VVIDATILQNVEKNFDFVLRVAIAVQDGKSSKSLVIDVLFSLLDFCIRILKCLALQNLNQ
jgi:hypothetical protein